MPWIRSRVAWGAGVLALFALLRALRRLVPPDDRPLALGVAIAVIVVVALLPVALGRGGARVSLDQAGGRKAVQLLAAAAVMTLVVYVGAGVVVAAALGVGAAALVPLVWPVPGEEPPAG